MYNDSVIFCLSDILKNYDQRMTTDDQMMLTGLRQILEDYMPPSDLDSFANILVVVKIAHDRLFRDMMDFIRYFQFEGRSFLL